MATITVRIPHERIPRIRLTIPSQFLLRFGAVPGAGAGAGTDSAAVTGGGTGITGEDGTCGTAAAGCAAGCRRGRGFPQFLQNRLVSGFWVPHSLQNIHSLPTLVAILIAQVFTRAYYRLSCRFPAARMTPTAAHRVLSPTPWPLARRARQVCWLISPTNIRLIFSLPMAVHAAGLLSWIATSHRQSTLK